MFDDDDDDTTMRLEAKIPTRVAGDGYRERLCTVESDEQHAT